MLGDTMSEPTQRASRSRYNSPFAAPPSNAVLNSASTMADVAEKPKTFIDRWVEPALAPLRPSFAEAGIERHGVVQNMAPLGTRPSAKILKATAKPESTDTSGRGYNVRRSGASSVSTPSETIMTPEPSTHIPRRRSLSTKPEPVQQRPQTPQAQMPEVQETPQLIQILQPESSAKKSLPRPNQARQIYGGQGIISFASPTQANSPHQYRPPSAPKPTQFGPNGEYTPNKDLTDKVVTAAVDEAYEQRRFPTAYALRTVYDDFNGNARMVRLIDSIFNNRATEDQIKEFKGVMKFKKKEGKKDNLARYYFVPEDEATPPPKQRQFSAVHAQGAPFSTPSRVSATGSRSLTDTQARRSSVNLSSALESPHKEMESHISKKHKSNNFQASSDLEMNGTASANIGGSAKASQPSASRANGTPKKGRPRSDSNSSSSSLSSIDEQILNNDYADAGNTSPVSQLGDGALGPDGADAHTQGQSRLAPNANTSSQAAEINPSLRNSTQPIIAERRIGPKTYTFSTIITSSPSSASLPSTNNSTSTRQHNSHLRQPSTSSNDAMAPAALLPDSSSSSSTVKSGKVKKESAKNRVVDESDPRAKWKRKAREITNNNTSTTQSFERHRIPLLPEFESISDGGDSVAAPSKRTNIRLINNKKTTRQSQAQAQAQAVNYDSDTLSSPTLLSFQPDLAPGSLSVSRAGTPSQFNRPTRKAKPGTGLRVKTSPMKKKGGTLAGIPRASGEGKSPTGNGAFAHGQEDNDDYCSSCGGNGDLVCCDGCTRSFHFKCVDPPINQDALPDEWFCNVCLSKHFRRHEDESGVFGLLLANLHRKNPSAFHLPKDIREYFVDVKTGTEGEYEEISPPKAKNRPGYDEAPDYFKLKDGKGNTILCHQCHGAASAPDRAIIPCTYCGLFWHLDCLDSPMAKEPGPGKPWKCPAHIDDLLTIIPAALAPAHRFRKIKGQSAIRPVFNRGLKNNGHIEIENDPSDDEEELGFYEQREYGHVYKLPELGIKLDFISQIREKTGGLGGFISPRASHSHNHVEPPIPAPLSVAFDQRSFVEQQAALNLASLIIPAPGVDNPQKLIDTLIAEASPEVIALIAQGSASNIAGNNFSNLDRNALLAVRDFIESKLAASSAPAPVEVEEVSPIEKTPTPISEVEAPAPAPAPTLSVSAEEDTKTVEEEIPAPTIENGVEDVEMSG